MTQNEIREIAEQEVAESAAKTREIRQHLIKQGLLSPSVKDNY